MAVSETESNAMVHMCFRTNHRERGQALIGTVVAISVVLLVLLATISITQLSNRAIARQLTYQGQALNAAEAGVTETLSWFRRQNRVVAAFAPVLNTTASPQVDDTDDVNCTVASTNCSGIVRTFDLSKAANLKGRYECLLGVVANNSGVLDVTQDYKPGAAAGTVWQLESTGYVWVVNDPSKLWNQSPNTVISKQTVRTQIQRMSISLPQGGAAVFSGKNSGAPATLNIGAKAKIQGGSGAGVASANASQGLGGTVTGTPATAWSSVSPYDVLTVFGVSQTELAALADIQVTKVSDLPNPLPTMSLIIINGNAVFDVNTPLTGSGIVVVYGDLNLSGQNNSSFSGVVYCTGNFTMDQPSIISGAVIVGNGTTSGTVSVGNGTGSDVAEIDYDPSIITQITAQMGQYRFSRGTYWVGK
jgi:hypothetical protein